MVDESVRTAIAAMRRQLGTLEIKHVLEDAVTNLAVALRFGAPGPIQRTGFSTCFYDA